MKRKRVEGSTEDKTKRQKSSLGSETGEQVVSVESVKEMEQEQVMSNFLYSRANLLIVKREGFEKVAEFLQEMIDISGNMPFIENEELKVSEVNETIVKLFEEFFIDNNTLKDLLNKNREVLNTYILDICSVIRASVGLALRSENKGASIAEEDIESCRVRLTLEGIDTDACKYFHQDFNRLRTLCTYLGPGTQWVENQYVNREALKEANHPSNECIVSGFPNNINCLKTGWVAVLKGEKFPNNKGNAIVHRSPPIEDQSLLRIVLRVDVIDS